MSRLIASVGLLTLTLVSAVCAPAEAQRTGRCIVSDPTGTPLNVRSAPQGGAVGRLSNGQFVQVLQASRDHKGQPWAYVGTWPHGRPIGWVFREFISCY
jgi:hypothetical protein